MGAFHAYDIRGIYNVDFDKDVAYKVGYFLPELLSADKVLVGRDARVSSPEIHEYLLKGITDAGADVYDAGLCTTPMVYFGTAFYGFKASVQITASHNPAQYNGMKVSRENALPVGLDTGLGQIRDWIDEGRKCTPAAVRGQVHQMPQIRKDYLDFLLKYKEDWSGLKIAMDVSNGMASLFVHDIFGDQPAYIYDDMDGRFPNHEPNPLVQENVADLKKLVAETKPDIGVIFDGDADRVMFTQTEENKHWNIFEVKLDGTGLKPMVECSEPDVEFYDGTYLPDGRVIAISNIGYQGVPCVSGADVLDGADNTDIASQLMLNNYYRTFCFYHEDTTDFPEVAVMSRCFTAVPGSETWANKKLAGVKVDPLTETQFVVLRNKNVNTFERFRNLSLTQTGKVSAGEWIDVIRFRDWLAEEIKVNVLNVIVNNEKVPYTDSGIAIIEGAIRQSLRQGQVNGGIAPVEYDEDGNKNLGYTVEVPLASNISANQKASRILTDVKFTARLAGAIHVVEIRGQLTYENLLVGGN